MSLLSFNKVPRVSFSCMANYRVQSCVTISRDQWRNRTVQPNHSNDSQHGTNKYNRRLISNQLTSNCKVLEHSRGVRGPIYQSSSLDLKSLSFYIYFYLVCIRFYVCLMLGAPSPVVRRPSKSMDLILIWTTKSSKIVTDFTFCKQSVMYDYVVHKFG